MKKCSDTVIQGNYFDKRCNKKGESVIGKVVGGKRERGERPPTKFNIDGSA